MNKTNLNKITKRLNKKLSETQPAKLSSSWISKNAPKEYRYFWKNIRTEIGDIDWDKIVSHLDKDFQKRWVCRHSKTKRQWQAMKWYCSKKEVNLVLRNHKDKLYTFLSPQTPEDRIIRNDLTIALVRISQKGNLSAKKEIISLLRFTADYWIDTFPSLASWKGYESELEEQIETCVRRYRFTGSFTTYLFRCLQYRGMGMKRLYLFSLDDQLPGREKRRIENVVKDPENNQICLYKPY